MEAMKIIQEAMVKNEKSIADIADRLAFDHDELHRVVYEGSYPDLILLEKLCRESGANLFEVLREVWSESDAMAGVLLTTARTVGPSVSAAFLLDVMNLQKRYI